MISRCSKLFYTISRCYFHIESTFSGASVSFVLSHIARYVPSSEENSCIPITHFQCKNNFEHLLIGSVHRNFSVLIDEFLPLRGQEHKIDDGHNDPPSAVAGVVQTTDACSDDRKEGGQTDDDAYVWDVARHHTYKPKPPVFRAAGTSIESCILLKACLDGVLKCHKGNRFRVIIAVFGEKQQNVALQGKNK